MRAAERLKQAAAGCKGYWVTLLCGGAFLGFFLLVRQNRAAMNFLVLHITTPWKRAVSAAVCMLPFSGMELCIAALVILGVGLLVRCGVKLKAKGPGIIGRTLLFFCCAGLLIYDGFCLFWGANYYADSFSDRSGLAAAPVSVESLYETTRYYAALANLYCGQVKRDEAGRFDESLDDIFAGAETVYDNIAERWAFLESPWRRPKRVFFSKIMSMTNFTGVFFPFLGESNLNVDSPASLIPSTIAHELAHQKNVAAEQEANFVAVAASVSADNPVYRYSGALLAYIHLGNALYQADRELWAEVYGGLDPLVRGDLDENNAYWTAYEGKAAEAAEAIYTGFLQSYGQTMGMKSYGACVDLLVNDYIGGYEGYEGDGRF